VTRPLAYLLGQVNDDGSIGSDPAQRLRDTAAALIALEASGNADHEPVVAAARDALVRAQLDESDGIGREDPRYGGFVVDGSDGPDLATHYRVLKALRMAGLEPDSPVLARARVFLGRCQEAGRGGGFAESPAAGDDAAPAPAMTYLGLAALLLAGAPVDDPGVADARAWISAHYDGDIGAGLSAARQVLVEDAFAAAMLGLGEVEITTADGTRHNWRDDLVRALLARFDTDTAWGGDSGDPDLATAGAVAVLNRVVRSLR
jgi:squalene-hopene/tetraprenyl-beta-curcumene cyclase